MRLLFIFALLPLFLAAQPSVEWFTKKHISWSNYGFCVSTGPEGNVYVSGAFVGPYRNPGPTDMGCFLTCYNKAGVELWHKEFYSIKGAITAFNKVDSEGNVVLAGPGVLRYNSTGILMDSLPSHGLRRCTGLVIDLEDNVIISGFCTPDSIIGELTVEGLRFTTKYSKAGKQLWAKACHINYGPNQDFDLAVDHLGNIYQCGGFGGTLTISSDISLSSIGHSDCYVVKYNSQFNPIWAKSFGGIYDEYSTGITVDHQNNIYITGTHGSPFQVGSFSVPTPIGVCDAFLIKFNAAGKSQWLVAGTGNKGLVSREIACDNNGNVFITGYFYGSQTVHWGSFSHITNADPVANSVFLAQIDSAGNAVSLTCSEDGGGGQGRDLICDNKGNIFLTGGFGGLLDFAGKTIEGEGMFLMKLSYDMNNKVGIQEETTEENLFQIFPNPGKGFFNLSLSDDLCPDAAISVFEISGRCILIKEHIACEERHFECIAPPGIYLVELRSGAKRQTKKVVIQ